MKMKIFIMVKEATLFPWINLFILLSILTFVKTVSSTSDNVENDAPESKESRIKVLLVKNADKQNILEEAAALSLDGPPQDSDHRQETINNDRLSELERNNHTSSGFRKVSLASLTLHQRDSKQIKRESSSPTLKPDFTQQQMKVPKQPDLWSELYLPRTKPSWLNVSSQYKISSNSIEEIESVLPVEYLLRAAFDSPILLKTKLGILEGVRSVKFNKHLYTFLSIPYAQPPVGELRFKPPEPIDKWEGIYQATKWPPFCVQTSMTLASKSSPVHVLSHIMSEDCLYLNIWTPSLKFNKNHKRPVMVWIHGGAFQYGGISVDENDGSALALLGDVVVVTFNYRVSAFGFLNANNAQNGPNNVGLLDQQLALEWVHNNIKQFGGDPQQVTLFGESAGGHSVGLHMISPKSQPLFKRAILQSGVPISQLRSYDANSDTRGPSTANGIASIMMAKRLKCFVPTPEQAMNEGSQENNQTGNSDSPLFGSSDLGMTTVAPETTTENETATVESTEPEPEMPILSDETLDCMRNKSSLEILKSMGLPGSSGFYPTGNDLKGFFPGGPIGESFDADNLKVGPQKDYLIGVNSNEGTFFLHYGLPSMFPAKAPPKVDTLDSLKAELVKEMERLAQTSPSNASDVQSASGSKGGGAQAHLYKPLLRTSSSLLTNFMPRSNVTVLENGTVIGNTSEWNKATEFGKNIGSLITDIIFLCPARALARTLDESGRNVYFYLYTHRSSLSQYHEWIGVTHHDEVEFVFGRPLRMADVYSGKDIEMSQRLIKTWAHFAYTGQMLDQSGLKWPKFGEEDNNYMVLTMDEPSVGQRYHDRVCNIYDTVISVHLQGH